MGEELAETHPSEMQDRSVAAKPRSVRWVFGLCLPTWLGAVALALSFPIDRPLPLIHSVNIAEVYGVLWLLVAPVCTLLAYVFLMQGTWRVRWSGKAIALAWTVFVVTMLVNVALAFGMIAATY